MINNFLLAIYFLSTLLVARAQVDIDLSITSSTNYRDLIIVKPEIKLKNWSIFVSGSYGGRTVNRERVSILRSLVINPIKYNYDSLAYVSMTNSIYRYINIDLGGAYHYSIHNNPYYYSGISGGISIESRTRTSTNKILDLYNGSTDIMPSLQYGAFTFPVISESNSRYQNNNLAWRVNIFSGFNIPISDRFIINTELNAGFLSSNIEIHDFWIFKFIPSIRGGFKYKIGNHRQKKATHSRL